MSWLKRLKNQNVQATYATKPTKPCGSPMRDGFVGFVAHMPGGLERNEIIENAANDVPASPCVASVEIPISHADRWCWPNSPAMNTAEIDTFYRRIDRFWGRPDAERLADRLVIRDREVDDRVMCVECRYLSGKSCQNWKRAEVTPQIPWEMQTTLQRCPGFSGV
jgi:hypothetical protein